MNNTLTTKRLRTETLSILVKPITYDVQMHISIYEQEKQNGVTT